MWVFESQDFYVQPYMYVVGISWELYKACDPSILLKLQNIVSVYKDLSFDLDITSCSFGFP